MFAYVNEVDEWLQTSDAAADGTPATPESPPPQPDRSVAAQAPLLPPPVLSRPGIAWRGWLAGAAVMVTALIAVSGLRTRAVAFSELRFTAAADGVTAFDREGRVQWRHAFPQTDTVSLLDQDEPLRLAARGMPAVYVATSLSVGRADGVGKAGVLTWLGTDGTVQRTFTFDDQVTFDGKQYGPPWGMTSFAIDETHGVRRVAVAGHHWTWDPGIVTVLDERWNRRGTFVHAGWIERVRWLSPDRLLVAGFSNPHDGGMIALLDPARMNGQGPEPSGSSSHCETCGPIAALRMVVMPRSEVNRASASRFNRAIVEITGDRIIVSTEETKAPDDGIHGAVSGVYEFTRSLELVGATFNDQYWAMHRTLEQDGTLTHTRAECPDRHGPRQVHVWEPKNGWQAATIR